MIERLLSPRQPRPGWVRVDAGHDCAVVDGPALEAITVDALVEGRHFAPADDPADVGYRAVAVSVSDLGACRARPRWMVLALTLPTGWMPARRERWVEGLGRGLAEASARWDVHLVGGDVTGIDGDGAILSVTMGGAVDGTARTRAGARPGDEIWLTGSPGLAGAGWAWADAPPAARAALLRPDPPLAFALALDVATAAMDLSDGLRADLVRLCAASGVGARIEPGALPVHEALRGRGDEEALRVVVGGGDDYELLFTAPPGASARIRALAAAHGVSVHRVGVVVEEPGAALVGRQWPAPLFVHFADGAAS